MFSSYRLVSYLCLCLAVLLPTVIGFLSTRSPVVSTTNSVARPLASQSSQLSDTLTSTLTAATAEVAREFEPVVNTDAVYGLLGVTVISTAAALVWWQQVVPSQRMKLAKSKANGEIKEYLEELRGLEGSEDRALEKWFYTDWLQKNKRKPAAIPFIKKVKWNSGDNPVLVAFGAIMACVLAASLAERVLPGMP